MQPPPATPEYYEALADVWEMFNLVAAQRKRREIDPMLYTLRRCGERSSPENLGERAAPEVVTSRRRRVEDLLSFLELVDTLAWNLFRSQVDELIRDGKRGKYALVRVGHPITVWDSLHDALQAVQLMSDEGKCMVQPVLPYLPQSLTGLRR